MYNKFIWQYRNSVEKERTFVSNNCRTFKMPQPKKETNGNSKSTFNSMIINQNLRVSLAYILQTDCIHIYFTSKHFCFNLVLPSLALFRYVSVMYFFSNYGTYVREPITRTNIFKIEIIDIVECLSRFKSSLPWLWKYQMLSFWAT